MNAEFVDFRFSPESVLWEVNRAKGTTLGGGGSALHMEVAMPPVADALDFSEFFYKRPTKRLHQTLDAGLDMTFGTHESSLKVAETINKMHEHVNGFMRETVGVYKAGDPYSAMDRKMQAWVGASIIDCSVKGYEMFFRDLKLSEKDGYLDNAKDLFTMLHLERDALPSRWEGLQEYIQDMIDTEQVKVGPLAKKLAPYLTLSHTRLSRIATCPIRRLTVYALRDDLREQFGYSMSDFEKQAIGKVVKFTKDHVVNHLPPIIRDFKQYRDAQDMLKAA